MKQVNFLVNKGLLKNPFFIFFPFLILYVAVVVLLNDPALIGDEDKYLNFTQNLLNGFYSPPAPNIYIGVGPGYSIVLMPFVWLRLPLIWISLFNALLLYLSIVFLYKALIEVVKPNITLIVSIFWGLYYNAYESLPTIIPETIAPFLFTLFLYFLIKGFKQDNLTYGKYIILAGLTFGYIALTKIIFGYVLLFMIIPAFFLWIFASKSANYRKGLVVLLIAMLTTLPYLFYTYHITGKVFYWGTTAGNNMYWMSTPYEEEYGSWYPDPVEDTSDSAMQSIRQFRKSELDFIKSQDKNIPGVNTYFYINHYKDLEEINKYSGVERDEAYRKLAIENIKQHPMKFIENCFSNLGRIVFNYPYSYKLQKPGTLLRFPQNGILVVLLILTLVPTLINWRKIYFPLRFCIFIVCLYMGGSLVGSAETRMFTVIVPILLLWISFILQRIIKINWKFDKDQTTE